MSLDWCTDPSRGGDRIGIVLVGTMAASRVTTTASLAEVGRSHHHQPAVGVDVCWLALADGSVVHPLDVGRVGHTGVIMQRAIIPKRDDRSPCCSPYGCAAVPQLNGMNFVPKVLGDEVEQGGAQLNDLLMREALALQLAVEALRDGLVAVQVQFFRVLVCHEIGPG